MIDRRGLITGSARQEGSYVADLLFEQGREVAGMMRRASTQSVERLADQSDRLRLVRPISSISHRA